MSTATPTPTSDGSTEDIQPIREIFASASKDESAHSISDQVPTPRHVIEYGVQRKVSFNRLQDVASKVRKRISRDSGLSKRVSRQRLRSSLSHEDVERRRELKRSLHQRLQGESLQDKTTSDEGYDDDAVPIKTPRSTWGRREGSIQIPPRQLSRTIERTSSPLPLPQAQLDPRDLSETYAEKSAAASLSRMLTLRGSRLNSTSIKVPPPELSTAVETPSISRTRTIKKYLFGGDIPKEPGSRSPSPLGRSNTVIRIPTSVIHGEVGSHHSVNTLESPPAPDLLPQRMASISDSVAGREWRLSYSGSRKVSLRPNATELQGNTPAEESIEETQEQDFRPARDGWRRGTSGLPGVSPYIRSIQVGLDNSKSLHSMHETRCDPGSEEHDFGGVDGNEGTFSPNRHLEGSSHGTRGYSDGSDPPSVHLYNMHIPQRLASSGLLPSASLPQLRCISGPDHSRNSSLHYKGGNMHRQASSSDFTSAKVPVAWSTPNQYAASSTYTTGSQPKSLADSQRSSILQISTLADRLHQFERYQPTEEIVSVPATRLGSVDLDRLERCNIDTSFHSSKESLTNRELAAAESRILPRANTLPKNSRFREGFSSKELEEISTEIARTNPHRRSRSNFDGSGDWSSTSQRRGYGYSFAEGDDNGDGGGIWEKALREHVLEDARLSKTRLGSEVFNTGRKELKHENIGNRKLKSRTRRLQELSNDSSKQKESLQASLGAYKLPPRAESPVKKTTQNHLSASSSSSWTRFPSHNRNERSSSPASEADNVTSRDFAKECSNTDADFEDVDPGTSLKQRSNLHGKKRKSKSMTFGRNMLDKLNALYRAQSLEFSSKYGNGSRGHRSSISEGGVVEYPELEMLPSLSPPLPGSGRYSPIEVRPSSSIPHREAPLPKAAAAESRKSRLVSPGAKTWSKLYQDCLVLPSQDPDTSSATLRTAQHAYIRSKDVGPIDLSRDRRDRSDELRASTLDFGRKLEEYERTERERVLGLGVGSRT